MSKKVKIKAYAGKCERCGVKIVSPKFSIFGANKTFKKYKNICGKCIKPSELKEIDEEINKRIDK